MDIEIIPDGPVEVVKLNRPKSLNAFSLEMVDQLLQYFEQLHDREDVRLVVLMGTGVHFSAGLDLKLFLAGPERFGAHKPGWKFNRLIMHIRECPQPIVAVLRGAVTGGGLSLAAASDVRVCDTTAKFSAAFVGVGLSGAELGLSWHLPPIIGASRATELMMTGRLMLADEALSCGFVSRVSAPEQLDTVAREIIDQMLRVSPLGLRTTKQTLNASREAGSLRTAIEVEERGQILCIQSEDFTEGVTAFIEKREPIYRGT